MSIDVPAAVQPYIKQAAAGTGLPYGVVAAQVNQESGFRTGEVSPTGALGPYQFEPGTWADLGYPAGQENNWPLATQAYVKFMRQLLSWAGGDTRKALAAYNAGEGGWQSGLGYANAILGAAGSVGASTAQPAGGGGGGLLSWPADIVGFFTRAGTAVDWLLQPGHWVRIWAGLGGGLMVAAGIWLMSHAGGAA